MPVQTCLERIQLQRWENCVWLSGWLSGWLCVRLLCLLRHEWCQLSLCFPVNFAILVSRTKHNVWSAAVSKGMTVGAMTETPWSVVISMKSDGESQLSQLPVSLSICKTSVPLSNLLVISVSCLIQQSPWNCKYTNLSNNWSPRTAQDQFNRTLSHRWSYKYAGHLSYTYIVAKLVGGQQLSWKSGSIQQLNRLEMLGFDLSECEKGEKCSTSPFLTDPL